jgi:hypothetical protein
MAGLRLGERSEAFASGVKFRGLPKTSDIKINNISMS